MYRKILVGMDNTEISEKAAVRGVDIAKKYGAEVLGVHVLDEEGLNLMDVGSEGFEKLKQDQRRKGEEALSRLEGLAKEKGVKFDRILTEGEPDKEIIKIANEAQADLIVLGSHGREGLARFIEPNTADDVREECPSCSIMIVI